jgi:hypothetical protein
MRLVLFGMIAVAGCAGLAVAAIGPPTPAERPIERAAPLPKPPASLQVVQASSKCSTPSGICFVPPLPVGSPCRCGNFSGVIIP